MQRREWELDSILYPSEPSNSLGPDLELDGFKTHDNISYATPEVDRVLPLAAPDAPRTRAAQGQSSPCVVRRLNPISLSLTQCRRELSGGPAHLRGIDSDIDIVEIPIEEDVSAQSLHSPTHLVAPFLHQPQEGELTPPALPVPSPPRRRSCVSCVTSLYKSLYGPVWGNGKKVQDLRILVSSTSPMR